MKANRSLMENVKTRQEMIQYLDKRMNLTYYTLLDKQTLEPETSLIKTYLVEAHISEEAHQSDLNDLFERLSLTRLPYRAKVHIEPTDDSTLYAIYTSIYDEPITIYTDVSNPRFWILHSINRSTTLDWLLDRLIKEQQFLDRAWIWPELLMHISEKGSFRGLGLDYDRRVMPDVDTAETPQLVEYMKMQLWGMRAEEVLRILSREFPQVTTLSKVKIKYWMSQTSKGNFSIDDVKFDGKITARGTSFLSHISLVADLYTQYSDTIKNIENKYALKWEYTENKVRLSGEALHFQFPKEIENLTQFCEHLFSSTSPFRLWGVPMEIDKHFYRVSAVDLHTGCRLGFEISPEFMRLYLPQKSCGNTIARLYTNLKHHYDAQIKALDADDKSIFQL